MSSAVAFLLIAILAAVLGSVVLWMAHRARASGPPDFQEQLRALAPREAPRRDQPSGIVPLESAAPREPGAGEER